MKRYAEDYDYIKDMGMDAYRDMKREERETQDLVDGFSWDDTIYSGGDLIQPSNGEVFEIKRSAYDPEYAPIFSGETHYTSESYKGRSLGIPMVKLNKKTIQRLSLLGLQFAANAFRAKRSIPALNDALLPTPRYKGSYPKGKIKTLEMGNTYLALSKKSPEKIARKLLKKYKGIPDWAEGLEEGVSKGILVIARSEDDNRKLCFEANRGAEDLLSEYFKVQKKGGLLFLDKKPVEYEIFQEENWTKRTISTDNQEKLDILAIANERLRPDHNKEFIEDCMRRLGEDESLTDQDLKRIRAIMYRIGMKPQTNSFRQASLRRCASGCGCSHCTCKREAGKTRRRVPRDMFRRPSRNIMPRDLEKVRSKAIPPNAYDDIPFSGGQHDFYGALHDLVEEGYESDQIVKKLTRRFKVKAPFILEQLRRFYGEVMRVASGEKSALQVSRSTATELSLRAMREIASELNCRLKDCYTQVLKEGYDRELGITYLLVYGENDDLMDHKSLFFVVADQDGEQAIEDFHKSEREMTKFFKNLIS